MENNLFSAHLVRGLTDKIYDKRKSAALEIEKLVRDNEAAPAYITDIIDTLVQDFVYSNNSNARNGGLIGLAATAIALGPAVAPYLDSIVPPILSCFSNQDSRVRYYACESMYNIAKVAKGEILRFFNSLFDAMCKLAADPASTVKNGAELLDRLIKDIVSELSTTYVSPHQQPYNPVESEEETSSLVVPTSLPRNTAFSLPRFIPVLSQRIYVKNSFTRQYLVSWIDTLNSIPDLELVSFLPEFLDGLLNCLSDPSNEVKVSTENLLGEFMQQIKEAASVSESDENGKGTYIPGQGVIVQYERIVETLVKNLKSSDKDIQRTALQWINGFIGIAKDVVIQFTPRIIVSVLPSLADPNDMIREIATETNQNLQKLVLSSPTPTLPTPMSPSVSDPVNAPTSRPDIDEPPAAVQAPPPIEVGTGEGIAAEDTATESLPSQKLATNAAAPPALRRVYHSDVGRQTVKSGEDPFDYQATVANLRLQFLNEHEKTRVASLEWLLMLHKKAPNKILTSDDGTFPALLKTLSDSSEEVVRRDLQLLAQISSYSDHEYFRSFMANLLSLFSTDRRLLETRGNLIIRQLCLSLDTERIYCTIADILEHDEDLEFASIMVQNLNIILTTSSELSDLRKRLRNLDHKDGQRLFIVLYRSWCHNAVATFSLCLLAQAYEHAANMLQVFAELEITVSMLIQMDKLVQLLESPVFTYLRLQLLEPEKYPYLYKCLYGILMLLPQSSAFSTLRNRLSSVSSLGYFHMMPTKSISASASNTDPGAATKPRASKSGSAASSRNVDDSIIKFQELLQHFKAVQSRHERQRKQAMQSIPRSNTLRSRRARYNSDPSALVTRNDGLVLSGGNQQHSGSIGGTGAAGNGSSSNGSKNGTLKHPTSNSSTDRVRGGNRMMTRKTTAAVPGRK